MVFPEYIIILGPEIDRVLLIYLYVSVNMNRVSAMHWYTASNIRIFSSVDLLSSPCRILPTFVYLQWMGQLGEIVVVSG